MWQDNSHQELVHGKWTDFSSTSNEVFIPDDRAWAVAENAAVDADENEQQSRGFVLVFRKIYCFFDDLKCV